MKKNSAIESEYQAEVDIPHPDMHWIGCLCHLHAELGRLRTSLRGLEIQESLYDGLVSGPCEYALSRMFDERLYDGELGTDARGVRRIEVSMFLRKNGELSVQWKPKKWAKDAESHLFRFYWERPVTELFSVRGVGDAMSSLHRRSWPLGKPKSVRDRVNQTLLLATAGAIKALKQRLEHQFDVQMKTDIFMSFVSDESDTPIDWKDDEIIDWRIETVEEIARLTESRELRKLKTICPIEVLVDALARSRVKKKTGPAPKGTDDGVSRLLRSDGFGGMSATVVGRYRTLLRKLSPEALPSWDRPKPEIVEGPSANARFQTCSPTGRLRYGLGNRAVEG